MFVDELTHLIGVNFPHASGLLRHVTFVSSASSLSLSKIKFQRWKSNKKILKKILQIWWKKNPTLAKHFFTQLWSIELQVVATVLDQYISKTMIRETDEYIFLGSWIRRQIWRTEETEYFVYITSGLRHKSVSNQEVWGASLRESTNCTDIFSKGSCLGRKGGHWDSDSFPEYNHVYRYI